ncbi:uncharacterized protein BP01DRAFT_382747 [Aspergillus saccharolyticus JOP 1030-1]|uniref:Uncharacterized protein n=1 Tax=Aspergillus saccharolyticus JOP 1030-1 TaxID=1450539 RepID=A0A318ZD82_9EURO|nr:hypothetical protein BP01DRAFT_382747 [Aspergillus saccharolyticus JOP 1030-1]PYH45305.1 hypothetical protein BP01DRAFT_382747 [Aspergillus saccharolyticus JOP 1030-1]
MDPQAQEYVLQRGRPANGEVSSAGHTTAVSMARYSHLEFADSIPSEESYIFDAIRAYSTSEECSHRPGSAKKIHRDLDSRLAAQPVQSTGIPPPPCRNPRSLTEKNTSSPGWHPHPAGHSRILSVDEGKAVVASPQDGSLKRNLFDVLHLPKSASLNDTDDASKSSQWLEYEWSANPVYPSYPPPVRSPTPPGLPTFGTPEAVNYSSRFHVQSATISNGQNQQHTAASSSRSYHSGGGGASERTRTASYGDKIRKIFRFSSTPPQPQRLVPAVARAEDGTAVQGRFPYRQSGHGVGVVRRMEDHPFHQRALSPPREESTSNHSNLVQQDRKPKREYSSTNVARNAPWRPTPARIGPGARASHHSAYGHFSSVSRLQTPDSHSPHRPCSANTAYTTSRIDSFHTCVSQLFSNPTNPQQHRMSTVDDQESEITQQESAACSLIPTESPAASAEADHCALAYNTPPDSWLQCPPLVSSCLSCCWGVRHDPDSGVHSNTSSHETYETARSHTSNDASAAPIRGDQEAEAEAAQSAQHPMQWLSEAWQFVHQFALRNAVAMGRLLN